MNRDLMAEQLDREIDVLMEDSAYPSADSRENALRAIANELRLLPSQQFKQQLGEALLDGTDAFDSNERQGFPDADLAEPQPLNAIFSGSLPALATMEFGSLPAHPRNLLLSFASHAAVVALIVSGIWVAHGPIIKRTQLVSDLNYFPMPVGDKVPHGGGSGGDRGAVAASRGTPPKFSNEQLAPPEIVARNPLPKLQVDSTVLGPPDLKLPQSKQIGELLSSNVVIPSNGTGAGGGIGNNDGTGVGIGHGPGAGGGSGGGCCTGAYVPGNGVSPPRALYDPEPEYSDEARKVKLQGIVVLTLVVDQSGHARDIRISRSLGMGLDERAIEAVKQWKFDPGKKDGIPVATKVDVEVTFHLY